MNNIKKTESGQAIVLIAFSLLVLIGFTALAIDGGMLYSDRRHAQNASDAGSLAGGGQAALSMENNHIFYADFDCNLSDVSSAMTIAQNAAQNLMTANGYQSADFSVTTNCQDSDSSYFQEKFIDVTTQIITDTETAFVHLVYDGPVQNTVDATTRVKPRTPLAYGHAVVGLNPGDGSCSASVEGVKIGGTGEISIEGGGIWSQSCLSVIGDCDVDVTGGGISYGGSMHGSCGEIDPPAQYQNDTLPEEAYSVSPPDCSAPNATSMSDIKLSGHQNLDLNTTYPGTTLFCLTSSGNAIQVTGGTLSGSDVTIYLPNSGDIRITGGVVNLAAPGADPDPDPALPGVLFYVPQSSVIKINGNSESSYLGLIYAPNSDIEIEGSGAIGPTMNTQVIGWNVSLLGSATIDIRFNQTWNYAKPTSIDLEE
jgi:hypothetical protein